MKHFSKYLLGLSILAISCTSGEFKPIDKGFDYFPLKTGFYQVYRVNSITYSGLTEPETLAYELMARVTDSFPNPEGNHTYVISRFKRPNASSPWLNLDTWSARVTGREAIVNEGNVPFVKLFFPVKANITWDGNKYNSMNEDTYQVIAFQQPHTAGGTTFEQAVTIEQENNEDFIVFLDQRKEVYAKDAGLVGKEVTQLSYCVKDQCRGQQIIETGIIYKQELIEYGYR